ncbi:hypothetical protein GH714_015988 [Hevea brasiliensis]|uniref:Uncharacterized protein n=1 Tax=Hevea brasiliensis TaxID=3981 RepID=A0A6A6L226_HEVBR|nr:hypothetical protein GH714_015988 [Hevea brasiliensis]
MARLDTTEKENTFLKYEFHMLEKELEVRNEELEYTRRSAEASHRQHLESVKKISNLEAECQRLRILMRKKLPGPATLTRMKNEVEMLGKDPIELRRKPNPTRDLVLRDTTGEKSSEIPVKNINFLIEQLRGMEEENRTLKEILTKKNTELRSSRIRYSQTASKLSQVETQLIELSGSQKHMDLAKCSPVSSELYPIAGFDFGSDDGLSSSGSWANALMSELEHFRGAKHKSPSDRKAFEVSDISLMDDFVEMEKLAVVSAKHLPEAVITLSQLRFILTCNSLLNGKAGLESFAEELLFTLDWIVNNCVTPKDASGTRDKIKKHFSRSESQSDNEVGVAVDFPLMDSNAICIFNEKPPSLPSVASLHEQYNSIQMNSGQCNLQEEIRKLRDELKNMESGKKEMETKLHSAAERMKL